MSSRADPRLWLLLASRASLAAMLSASGCYASHLCGDPESCNGRDDDCDGLVDEDFLDARGRYHTLAHCGGCGVDCREVFPTAGETACEIPDDALPFCRIVSCATGFHLAGSGACVPDVPALCLPCTTDSDCALREPDARCTRVSPDGPSFCSTPCGTERAPCLAGFTCAADGLCMPDSGECACSAATVDDELACIVRLDAAGHACAGVIHCGPEGRGDCEPVLEEACNAEDDDCDGLVDEDFRDDAGRYVSRLHCGACARPCVEPGAHMIAACSPDGASARCDLECEEGFVDVNRILADGCECERATGGGPPPVGGDSDCDGVPDDTTDFVYVTTTGSDTNPGSLAFPMRSIQAALARGQAEGKTVLVSRGVYDGPFDVVGGVDVFGGYSPDFTDRDLELYPVLVERRDLPPGAPALTCHGVTAPTRIEGFTVQGTDATAPGEGSTAVYVDGCGPAVRLGAIVVLAGRGANGANGDDSSTNLRDWGLMSLDQLAGVGGGPGRDGTGEGSACTTVTGGAPGAKTCRARDVSGGAGGAAACAETGCRNGSPCANAGCVDFTVGGVCDIDTVLRLAVANPAPGAGRGSSPGGAGELTYNAPTDRFVCNFCDDNPTLNRLGTAGGDGTPGVDGAGGAGCGMGQAFDAATGRVAGGAGVDGGDGTDGSGGGGASAGAGYDVIMGTPAGCDDRSGGSGGGGGSGGCGAPRADAGGGGGASIGIVVRLASGATRGPTLTDVRIVTASGGVGGNGGIGASGGTGGSGANGGVGRHWCARTGGRGGDGGRGGAGGGAGGGCGGDTHGVYVVTRGVDARTYRDEITAGSMIELAGVPGRGGAAGFSPGESGRPGRDASGEPVFLAP